MEVKYYNKQPNFHFLAQFQFQRFNFILPNRTYVLCNQIFLKILGSKENLKFVTISIHTLVWTLNTILTYSVHHSKVTRSSSRKDTLLKKIESHSKPLESYEPCHMFQPWALLYSMRNRQGRQRDAGIFDAQLVSGMVQ